MIELNNGNEVLQRLKRKSFLTKIPYLHLDESGMGSVSVSDENIRNNSEFILNLFDAPRHASKVKRPGYLSKNHNKK